MFGVPNSGDGLSKTYDHETGNSWAEVPLRRGAERVIRGFSICAPGNNGPGIAG